MNEVLLQKHILINVYIWLELLARIVVRAAVIQIKSFDQSNLRTSQCGAVNDAHLW